MLFFIEQLPAMWIYGATRDDGVHTYCWIYPCNKVLEEACTIQLLTQSDFDRVYVLSGKSKIVPIVCGLIIFAQWAIVLYLTIYSFEGSNQVALLLSPPIYPLPTIPAIDAYNSEGCPMIRGTSVSRKFSITVCLFIATRGMAVPTYPSNPFMEAWLCLSLTYETIIFLSISYLTLKMSGLRFSVNSLTSIVNIIQRDSILYFLVLFFSSLAWLILLLHAPVSFSFIFINPI